LPPTTGLDSRRPSLFPLSLPSASPLAFPVIYSRPCGPGLDPHHVQEARPGVSGHLWGLGLWCHREPRSTATAHELFLPVLLAGLPSLYVGKLGLCPCGLARHLVSLTLCPCRCAVGCHSSQVCSGMSHLPCLSCAK
jgi:hypothetical protein